MMVAVVKRPVFWWLAVVVWAAVLWWLSSRPGSGAMPAIPHFDKVMHAGYFFVGGLIFQTALSTSASGWRSASRLLLGFLLAFSIGALDEYHQTFTPNRSGNDPFDLLADVVGGCLAAWLAIKRQR